MQPESIETCSLASGSKGNAYFFRTQDHAFLIDAGISCRQIKLKLAALGTDINNLSGIFITHEHGDHIRGLKTISKNHQIPLYINKKTYSRLPYNWKEGLLKIIKNGESVQIGASTIHARSKSHDVADPCFFIISHGGKHIPILTDLGRACSNAINAVRAADALYLETNYDPKMLRSGTYPDYVQARISSTRGHLSNQQAAALLLEHATPRLRYLFLSHLSENNNTPSLARRAIREVIEKRTDLQGLQLITAVQDGVSKIIRI